jgi:hypothetical protein
VSAPKVEISAQPVTFFRGIEDETGEPFLIAVQIDDEAGGPLQYHTLRPAAFGARKAGHSCTTSPWSGDNTPGLVLLGIPDDADQCSGHADHRFRDDPDRDSGMMPITRSGMIAIS